MEARDIMTAKELQKRNGKSENLRVLQTEDGNYFCESSEGRFFTASLLTTRACPAPVGIGLVTPSEMQISDANMSSAF